MPPIFRPKLVWDVKDELMVVASYSDYTVKILRDGQVVGELTGNTPPRRVTTAMLRREIGDLAWGPPGGQCVIPAEQVIEGRGYAEFLAPISDLVISPDGEIWVLRGSVKDEPILVDIFTATGDLVGALPPESPFPASFAGPNRMLAIGSDEFGSTLAMYRIDRFPPSR